MPKIEIYTTTICPYCHDAKDLLQKKGVAFDEINLNQQPQLRDTMVARAQGGTTVPQIFIDGTHIGGCDDIYALEAKGALDPLLGS